MSLVRPLRRTLAIALWLALAAPAGAATFTVTSNADSGPGTLRAALAAADAAASDDTIAFDLPAGQRTITLATPLPGTTGNVDIDGTSQPGWVGIPLVRLDGAQLPLGSSGLRISAGTSTVRGLMITRFSGTGLLIDGGFGHQVYGNYIGTDGGSSLGNHTGVHLGGTVALVSIGQPVGGRHNVVSGNLVGVLIGADASFNTVVNNRVGTNATGDIAIPNDYAGLRVLGSDNSIGTGSHPNTISGNIRFGIEVSGDRNTFFGNRIGTTAGGTGMLGNSEAGLHDSGDDNRIGGLVDGSGNIVSGNGTGMLLSGQRTVVVGNRVGTNAAGTAKIRNAGVGIRVFGSDIAIGDAGAGNLVSGNQQFGIEIAADAARVDVRHNRIGTNLDGTLAIPNAFDGVYTAGSDVRIGGTDAGNLISGNAGNGIGVGPGSHGLDILGNRVGTRADGMGVLPNGGYAVRAIGGDGLVLGAPGLGNLLSGNARGVILEQDVGAALVQANIIGLSADQSLAFGSDEYGLSLHSGGHQIGGDAAGEGNVIAASDSSGIYLGAGADGNLIGGNHIGTDAAGTTTFGNGHAGIHVYRANDNLIGGGSAASGNDLRGAGFGVHVELGTGNTIVSNRMADNAYAGIELDPHGPDANDPFDADYGPNLGQNRPVPTRAEVDGGNVSLTATLDAAPSTPYLLQFFHADACHPGGIGEGEHLLGTGQQSTDANGHMLLAWNAANPFGPGVVTMTATDPAGNTSEFSPCVAIGPTTPGEFTIWHDPLLAYEARGTVRIAVIRAQGFEGPVSVRVKTVDGSATAPSDYTAVDTVLHFGGGDWVRSIDVPLVHDAVIEGDEAFRVELSSPTGGATLGAMSGALVWLFDHDPAWPSVTVDDVQAIEPGGTGFATFVVRSSGSDHPFTLDYATADGSATAGADYLAVSGTLTFDAQTATHTVAVPLLGDGIGEPGETFFLHLSGASGDFIASDPDAEAVILDDDGGALFRDGFE